MGSEAIPFDANNYTLQNTTVGNNVSTLLIIIIQSIKYNYTYHKYPFISFNFLKVSRDHSLSEERKWSISTAWQLWKGHNNAYWTKGEREEVLTV